MKRPLLTASLLIIAVVGLIAAANWKRIWLFLSGPYMGNVTESWQTSNHTFKLRVDRHSEENAFLAGAYYVFQSAPAGSDSWQKVMIFRHDDPNPIARDQVRFVNDQVAFVFMGWMYAVTTDAGNSWSVWNGEKELPKGYGCNYRLIRSVNIDMDGAGTMILNPIPQRQGELPELHTTDFGRHWNL
jgi:hypothetical protein